MHYRERLAALVCKVGTRDLLAQLFGVDGSTLTRAVHPLRSVLAEYGRTDPRSTAKLPLGPALWGVA